MKKTLYTLLSGTALLASLNAQAAGDVNFDDQAEEAPYSRFYFAPDPSYKGLEYDAEAEQNVYGGKTPFDTPRPLLELGYPIYGKGPIPGAGNMFPRNPSTHQFTVYGDFRIATAGYAGESNNGGDNFTVIGTVLNLELDWKITGTERIHMALKPLQDQEEGEFTRIVKFNDQDKVTTSSNSLRPESLFFEGDLGAMTTGSTGNPTSWDMPIALGLMPLQFQNGYFLDDAITGMAVSFIAKHNTEVNISNYDVTLFLATSDIEQQFVAADLSELEDDSADIFGLSAYLDANKGHWEINFGYSSSEDLDLDFATLAIGFTRRYGSWLSNSIRLMHSSDLSLPEDESIESEAVEGTLLVFENSIITSLPSTFIPYFNIFYADGTPQPLARDAAKAGILTNVGITFEADGLTLFQGINATPTNTYGAAIGLEYLFDLTQQVVFEIGYQDTLDEDDFSSQGSDVLAIGFRHQYNFGFDWAVKTDLLHINSDSSSQTDESAIRVEFFKKF